MISFQKYCYRLGMVWKLLCHNFDGTLLYELMEQDRLPAWPLKVYRLHHHGHYLSLEGLPLPQGPPCLMWRPPDVRGGACLMWGPPPDVGGPPCLMWGPLPGVGPQAEVGALWTELQTNSKHYLPTHFCVRAVMMPMFIFIQYTEECDKYS